MVCQRWSHLAKFAPIYQEYYNEYGLTLPHLQYNLPAMLYIIMSHLTMFATISTNNAIMNVVHTCINTFKQCFVEYSLTWPDLQ